MALLWGRWAGIRPARVTEVDRLEVLVWNLTGQPSGWSWSSEMRRRRRMRVALGSEASSAILSSQTHRRRRFSGSAPVRCRIKFSRLMTVAFEQPNLRPISAAFSHGAPNDSHRA